MIKKAGFITTESISKSLQVQKQANSGVNFEDMNVDLKQSFLKPPHATWLVEMYRPGLDVELHMRRIKHLFESLRKKNSAFDLDVALHVPRIEFVSAGNTLMGIIKLIFFSQWQVCN